MILQPPSSTCLSHACVYLTCCLWWLLLANAFVQVPPRDAVVTIREGLRWSVSHPGCPHTTSIHRSRNYMYIKVSSSGYMYCTTHVATTAGHAALQKDMLIRKRFPHLTLQAVPDLTRGAPA